MHTFRAKKKWLKFHVNSVKRCILNIHLPTYGPFLRGWSHIIPLLEFRRKLTISMEFNGTLKKVNGRCQTWAGHSREVAHSGMLQRFIAYCGMPHVQPVVCWRPLCRHLREASLGKVYRWSLTRDYQRPRWSYLPQWIVPSSARCCRLGPQAARWRALCHSRTSRGQAQAVPTTRYRHQTQVNSTYSNCRSSL